MSGLMDENPIFSLSAGVFFLSLMVILFCLLFSCVALGKICKQLDVIPRIPVDKPVLINDQIRTITNLDLQKDEPPPYDSLPPSYEESMRKLNQV
ncbi:hypothetical protein TNCT_107441 [Trichonephila clavata]|uniref:Uncharacterized protein n=2 Tax=Trichonephila clavata TaxID=2740835 RepID=A0A8X6HHH4_TRICU|nr:hypothetical protein TNCT_107441 [Trichonephila clavata]